MKFLYYNSNNISVSAPEPGKQLIIIVHGWNDYDPNGNNWMHEMKNAIFQYVFQFVFLNTF